MEIKRTPCFKELIVGLFLHRDSSLGVIFMAICSTFLALVVLLISKIGVEQGYLNSSHPFRSTWSAQSKSWEDWAGAG